MLRIQNKKKNTDIIPAFSAFVVERFEERATALYNIILRICQNILYGQNKNVTTKTTQIPI